MDAVRCKDIRKSFQARCGYPSGSGGFIKALDGVSLTIAKGESRGLVGESGSGKTTLGKIILGILKPDSGTVELDIDRPQVVFQDPYNSLDPRMKVFDILAEGLVLRKRRAIRHCEEPKATKQSSDGGRDCFGLCPRNDGFHQKIGDVLDLVKLPQSSLGKYPHQFSGGERQRIAIGRALATEPDFIVCDEPVSSLDVTIQLQILRLLKDIQKELKITYLFISHDLRAVRFMCDRVAVMKDGKIVEEGSISDIYSSPSHTYTKLLLTSIPTII